MKTDYSATTILGKRAKLSSTLICAEVTRHFKWRIREQGWVPSSQESRNLPMRLGDLVNVIGPTGFVGSYPPLETWKLGPVLGVGRSKLLSSGSLGLSWKGTSEGLNHDPRGMVLSCEKRFQCSLCLLEGWVQCCVS